MNIALVAGSSGMIGSASDRFFAKEFDEVALNNDLRRYFLGESASTAWCPDFLLRDLDNLKNHVLDLRDSSRFKSHFLEWSCKDTLEDILTQIFVNQRSQI